MTTKKRGRPRKIRPMEGKQVIPFELLPTALGDGDRGAVAMWFREYLGKRPHIPRDSDLQKWLDAAADAVEQGDATRVGYYAFQAMRLRALLVYQELDKLAEIGKGKLVSDKRRGRRIQWDEFPRVTKKK